MAIFGRRRASSNPRPSTTSVSPAATLAASQAFLANKASNANLSSAAATAALRAHTPNPTPVGQLQTKRMLRRGSLTSQTSAPDGKSFRPGALQRRDSGGSMTERTFRSPSPGTPQDKRERPASSHGPYPHHDQNNAPPVPALPSNYVSPTHKSNESTQRPGSVEPPRRISSPPPKQANNRGMRSHGGKEINTPTAAKARTQTNSNGTGDLERVGSRSPINFSRPMSPENAPLKSSLAGGRVRSPPPAGPSGPRHSPSEEGEDKASSQITSVAPLKKKKKTIVKGSADKSDVSADTTREQQLRTLPDGKVQQESLPLEPVTSSAFGLENTTAKKSGRPKKKKTQATPIGKNASADSFGAAYPSDTDSVTSERSSTTDRPRSYNTRAAGLLAKQPSIVREDREGEKEAEDRLRGSETNIPTSSNGTAVPSSPATSSRPGSKGRQHGRSVSEQVSSEAPNLNVPRSMRHSSLSPGRTAHFSIQPVNEGKKHQPPGRSVSPAKSALKSSPSRGHSPMVNRQALAPSDASDSTSQHSDDGSKSSLRKKSTRVSFDEEPVIVGRSADASTPGSPNIMSPQHRSAKTRTWIDLVQQQQEQEQDGFGADQEDGSAIKPTPALPSFGSIRDRELRLGEDAPTTPTEQNRDPSTDKVQTLETSADSAIGSLIAVSASTTLSQDDESPLPKVGANDPLPPQVTSVEGSGYHSDEGDLFDEGPKRNSEHALQLVKLEGGVGHPDSNLPLIAVQPATPALDSTTAKKDSWLSMPGGFPPQKANEGAPTPVTASDLQTTPVSTGPSKPEIKIDAEMADSRAPIVGAIGEKSRIQTAASSADESDETDADSVYSDAAEDQTDPEGDGFGSINAIVESPTSANMGRGDGSPLPGDAQDISAQPSPAERTEHELSEPPSSEGWDRAQAYWSGLSQTRKQQLEQAALPGAIDEPVIRNRSMRGADAVNKRKKKKKPKKAQPQPLGGTNVTSTAASSTNTSGQPYSSQIDSTPHLRSSMRDDPVKLALQSKDKRSSMTSQSQPKAALQKKTRPMSAAAIVDYSSSVPKSVPKSAQTASAATPVSTGNSIKKQRSFPASKSKDHGANSDSDSSFKKSHPKGNSNQRYTMRRTMRSQSGAAESTRSNSMAARAASPAEANVRRAFSQNGPNGTVGMRTSMRGPIEPSKPTRTSLRNSIESSKASRTKSPSRFSFLGPSKTKTAGSEAHATSRFSSRFGDSSDEEEFPAMASSRFADSSDDENPDGLTPVRGIPSRINEGDSTELDDSSEDKIPPPTKASLNANGASKPQSPPTVAPTDSVRDLPATQPTTPTRSTDLQAKKALEKDKKKRSFFGSLSGKKRDGSVGAQKPTFENLAKSELTPTTSGAEQMAVRPESSKPSGLVLGPSSLAADPVGMRKLETNFQTGSQTSVTQSNLKSPKLQRRITPKRITSSNDISWPLPHKAEDSVTVPPRPQTSDGPTATNGGTKLGPSLVLRHSVQAPLGTTGPDGPTLASPTKKKKKFSILRKAFGLQT